MTALAAYHNDPNLKTRTLNLMQNHKDADQLIQGTYWDEEEQRGCAVGCLLHDPDGGHERYETEFGIPEQLAWLEDGIFEALPVDVAKEWPERFLDAIPVGADLTTVWPRFAIWMMTDPKWGLAGVTEDEGVKDVCQRAAGGYERILAGTLTVEPADAISRAAWAARDARDARAAWAAWDAWAARAARAAFTLASADKFIELLDTATTEPLPY